MPKPSTAASAKKLAIVPPATPAPTFIDDPAAKGFVTDNDNFFGLQRQVAMPRTPTADEVSDFMFDPKYEDRFRALADGENLLLIGPPGCGKSLSAKWFAHHWGQNFYFKSHDQHTQADDIISATLQDPETGIWKSIPSDLVVAYRDGGVFCADEILAVKPGPLQVYHPFLNGDAINFMTPNGTVKISRHHNFRFAGTGNHWAKTAGNYQIGEALLDRCIVVEMDYISEELESEAIMRHAPDAPPGLVEDLVRFAAHVRNGVKTNPDRNHYLPSTRMLGRLARHISRGRSSVEQACESIIFQNVLIRYPEELPAIRQVFNSIVAL